MRHNGQVTISSAALINNTIQMTLGRPGLSQLDDHKSVKPCRGTSPKCEDKGVVDGREIHP